MLGVVKQWLAFRQCYGIGGKCVMEFRNSGGRRNVVS
jgi:hypothetical protein